MEVKKKNQTITMNIQKIFKIYKRNILLHGVTRSLVYVCMSVREKREYATEKENKKKRATHSNKFEMIHMDTNFATAILDCRYNFLHHFSMSKGKSFVNIQ